MPTRYMIGCFLKTVNTGLECEIEIGHTRKNTVVWAQSWMRLGGRLDIRDDDGDWMYDSSGGITLVSTADDSDPYWHNPANWLVQLDNVPERFAEKLGCGEHFLGEGKLFLTGEKIHWKMWYYCV